MLIMPHYSHARVTTPSSRHFNLLDTAIAIDVQLHPHVDAAVAVTKRHEHGLFCRIAGAMTRRNEKQWTVLQHLGDRLESRV